MTKGAAKKKKTTTSDESVEGYLNDINAKSLFISSTINMGWQLAITVVVPLVLGVKIDERFNTSPSFTLLGIMIAVAAGSSIVWKSVQDVNEQTKDVTKDTKLDD